MRPLIEPETTEDIPSIRAVVLAAFTDEPAVADLVEAIRESPHYEPGLSLIARVDGEIAGFVMISHAELVEDAAGDERAGTRGRRHDVLTLSPLAVAPQMQRRGIGSALVRAGLAAADRAGAALVLLEGSPAYYGRRGFGPAADAGITMELPDWAPPAAAQIHRLGGYRPEVRGRLVYPPAFDAVR